MKNRRKYSRKLMFDMLPVSLAGLGDCIGYLVDITPAGLMLRSTCAVEQGKTYGIRVELREPVDGVDTLEIQGECIWCRPAPAMNGFNAGFSFTESMAVSERLIEELGRPPVPANNDED
jgi:hypothetical protein